MKKHLFLPLLVICLLFVSLVPAVSATETEESTAPTEPVVRAADECGDDLTWSYKDGTLTIAGSGKMDDYAADAPWAAHKNDITKLILSDDVTYIGARAFRDYDKLETVDFGKSLYEIGQEAFASCGSLTSIELPSTFKIFGEGCFQSCESLKEIHCNGRFPSFRQNCLWATYVTIYYPAATPWNTDNIRDLEEAFKGRVEFLASDGTDHYEPTEEATEPEETVPETTVPETEPPVETAPPATEPPATEAVTEPEVTGPLPTETEAPATEPVPQEEDQGGMPTGLIIVLVVLGFILIGALIFGRGSRRRGKYSR